jgi:23S rRNA (guanosine2251-2'-O)-methyltransferase
MSETGILFGFHAVTGRLRADGRQRAWRYYLDAGRARCPARELLGARADRRRAGHRGGGRRIGSNGSREHRSTRASQRAWPNPAGDQARCASSTTFFQGDRALLLVLDGVQDPHNLGACLRVADAFGAQAVIAPKDRAVGVEKVASGASQTVPYVQVTNLARALTQLQRVGIWLMGADQGAEQPIAALSLTGPVAWILGSEGQGLRRLTRDRCDSLATIPMVGAVGSLNVAVAAGICLYETCRQRTSQDSSARAA